MKTSDTLPIAKQYSGAEQARLCELAEQKEAESRQFLAFERAAIRLALATQGVAELGRCRRAAAESLMLDVVDQPDSPLLRRLCDLYAMAARGEPLPAIGYVFHRLVTEGVHLAAEKNWQAKEDGAELRRFIPGVRDG